MAVETYSEQAIQSVLNAQQSYCKFLSANDTGATKTKQGGILVSKTAQSIMFTQPLENELLLKRTVKITWQDDIATESNLNYYSSKNELRITQFGRHFPFLKPDQTGALFVFIKLDNDNYKGYFLETEDDIEHFLDTFSIAPTETNQLIDTAGAILQNREDQAIRNYINGLTVDFPASVEMATAARQIHNSIYNHLNYVQTNPDKKIIEWTNMEYALFRAIESDRYNSLIKRRFQTVDDFIQTANIVLNRRKSRAGKSLEHHLAAVFDGNGIQYAAQAVTEGRKKPDFLFPSQKAYRDKTFPADKLICLAAKTTCKDRWRQVINEADRIKIKYLCTLQQGISPAQMDEMQAENIVLVVPKPYIESYPHDRQDRIWTLKKFVKYIREVEQI